MKKTILILLIGLLSIAAKGQAPGLFLYVYVKDSICIEDSCITYLMPDSTVNPAWVRAYVETYGGKNYIFQDGVNEDPSGTVGLGGIFTNDVEMIAFLKDFKVMFADTIELQGSAGTTFGTLRASRYGAELDYTEPAGAHESFIVKTSALGAELVHVDPVSFPGGEEIRFLVFPNGILVKDEMNEKGMSYDDDYYPNNVNNPRWIPDLGAVKLLLGDSLPPAPSFDTIYVGGKRINFNESEGMFEFETGDGNVVWQGALEDLVQVYNNTASTITNGTPCYFSGSNGDTIVTVGVASADLNAISFIGLATGDIIASDWGYVATRGKVRGIPISGLSLAGALFLSSDSSLTNTKPAYPNEVVIVGGVIDATNGDATVYVNPSLALKRQIKSKSYTFTSLGIGSGEYWKAGFYDASATDANLTQASLTITHGTADVSYEAHPFAVYGGVGSVTGGGRVALIVTGTSYNDVTGSQTPADIDTIINDITNAVLNAYDEAKKYLGTVTYSLVVVEGAPSAYSLDFNYGFAKYDDLNDKDFYIAAIEAVWIGDGTDATGFNIELYKHTQTGWTYAASGFDPGNGVLADRATDQAGFLRVLNRVESAWKRSRLNEYINGTGEEGYLIKITTGASSTIQSMDIHVESALD